MNNSIALRNINSLSGLKFFIPDYQRGYRWGSKEVENLLNDIREFCLDIDRGDVADGEFYCLQPVVARKISGGDSAEEIFELIDGQQRLTTIYIILKYLSAQVQVNYEEFTLYNIEYQTRINQHDSHKFLDNLGANTDGANTFIDFHYMNKAYKVIDDWFKKNENKKLKRAFTDALLKADLTPDGKGENTNNVRILWYELGDCPDDEAIAIFMRLNMGKIPLSNAELVKALLLKRSNFSGDHQQSRAIALATEWNEIERKLQQDDFWHFITRSGHASRYDTRLEYILDLVANKPVNADHLFTFLHFNAKYRDLVVAGNISSENVVNAIWMEIREHFRILEELHNDHQLYHYAGFLIENGASINTLINEYKSRKKDEFLNKYVFREIAARFKDIDLEDLEYGDPRVRKVLLLFNLITSAKSETRFPFDKFKKMEWDVEHITSQTDATLAGSDEQKEWIEDVMKLFDSGQDSDMEEDPYQESWLKPEEWILVELRKCLKQVENGELEQERFDKLFKRVQEHLNEQNSEGKNQISNLVLLDKTTNRSYQNAFFPIKRRWICDNDKNGELLPPATKNVFLKYYTPLATNMLVWTKRDAQAYLEAMKAALQPFLPAKQQVENVQEHNDFNDSGEE